MGWLAGRVKARNKKKAERYARSLEVVNGYCRGCPLRGYDCVWPCETTAKVGK